MRHLAFLVVFCAGCSLSETADVQLPGVRRIAAPEALTAVADFGDEVLVGSQRGLWTMDGDHLRFPDVFVAPPDRFSKGKGKGKGHHEEEHFPEVKRLLRLGDVTWSINDWYLWRRDGNRWVKAGKGRYASLCLFEGDVVGASSRALYRFRRNRIDRLNRTDSEAPILDVLAFAGKLYVLHERSISVADPDRRYKLTRQPLVVPGADVRARAFLRVGDSIMVTTSAGTYRVRVQPGVLQLESADYLDGAPGRCLALGVTGALWVGRDDGVVRLEFDAEGAVTRSRSFPIGPVNAITCGARWVYAAADTGLYVLSEGAKEDG